MSCDDHEVKPGIAMTSLGTEQHTTLSCAQRIAKIQIENLNFLLIGVKCTLIRIFTSVKVCLKLYFILKPGITRVSSPSLFSSMESQTINFKFNM